jgi:glycosyltransferase involved in cell wall biosynthesis
MKLTVGICTWNRAAYLDKNLSGMYALEIPPEVEWELLIVNNNCTDHTDEVISKHLDKLPIRRIFESRPGKSFALNHAINEANGDYIIWTDDDAQVNSPWLKAYYNAFIKYPDVTFFGGPVKPWFEGTPPLWLEKSIYKLNDAYALLEPDDDLLISNKYHIPNGINWAIRTKEQKKYLYDTRLGPRPNSSLRGEEGVLMIKMLTDGLKGRWVPEAVVQHLVPKSRQTIHFLRGYYRGAGEFQTLHAKAYNGPTLFGKPRWRWRDACQKELQYRISRLRRGPEDWMEDLINASIAWGRLLGGGKNPVR